MKPVNKDTVKAELDRLLTIKKDYGQLSLRDEWIYQCLFELHEGMETVPCKRPLEYMGTNKPSFAIDVLHSKQEKK